MVVVLVVGMISVWWSSNGASCGLFGVEVVVIDKVQVVVWW